MILLHASPHDVACALILTTDCDTCYKKDAASSSLIDFAQADSATGERAIAIWELKSGTDLKADPSPSLFHRARAARLHATSQ